MKENLIFVTLISLIVLFVSACETNEVTYTTGVMTEGEQADTCMEITTSDDDFINDMEDAGLTEGSCPSSNRVGTCAVTMPYGDEQKNVNVDISFYSPTYNAETAAVMCAILQSGGM